MDIRLELIEIASRTPEPIKDFYEKHLVYFNGDALLSSDAPPSIELFFRGKLKSYDSYEVPFILAGVNPYGKRKCDIAKCMNPAHVI
jgi:hypothetical protein